MSSPVQSEASPFSMMDSDLPLLALDAAYEVEQIMSDPSSNCSNAAKLQKTSELLDRLRVIASKQDPTDIDSLVYEQSFLPTLSGKNEFFEAPGTIQPKLDAMLSKHQLFGAQEALPFLESLRDFFIELSQFASSSRLLFRRALKTHPNATL